MTRQTLDEYLDGVLSPQQTAEIDATLRTDAAAAGLLVRIKRERALRSAALAGYAPSSDEAESAAVRMIAVLQDETQLPAGRIGPWLWVRRAGSIAAVLALVAGAFAFGRASVSPDQVVKTVYIEKPAAAYSVLYTNDQGEVKTDSFENELAARAFIADRIQATGQNRQAVASVDEQGVW